MPAAKANAQAKSAARAEDSLSANAAVLLFFFGSEDGVRDLSGAESHGFGRSGVCGAGNFSLLSPFRGVPAAVRGKPGEGELQ